MGNILLWLSHLQLGWTEHEPRVRQIWDTEGKCLTLKAVWVWKSGVFPTVPLVMVTGGARQEKSQLLQSQQKNLAQTTAGSSSLSWRKIQFEDKFLQRLTDKSARLHGLKVHFQVYRSSLCGVWQTHSVEISARPQREHKNLGQIHCLLLDDRQNRHKKLLISPLPTFHFYHQDCNFCSFELGQKDPE